jgi:hypothetical protein
MVRTSPIERSYRDASLMVIGEGTNEIQRLVIAREMLKENRAFLLAEVSGRGDRGLCSPASGSRSCRWLQ